MVFNLYNSAQTETLDFYQADSDKDIVSTLNYQTTFITLNGTSALALPTVIKNIKVD